MVSASRSTPASARPALSPADAGLFCEALATAHRKLGLATRPTIEQYDLGPRGAWIIGLLSRGTLFPSDLIRICGVGASLVTAELSRLEEAGLVRSSKSERDGRRLELSLTSAGEAAAVELGDNFAEFVSARLPGYSREDIMFCTRLLQDFARAGGEPG